MRRLYRFDIGCWSLYPKERLCDPDILRGGTKEKVLSARGGLAEKAGNFSKIRSLSRFARSSVARQKGGLPCRQTGFLLGLVENWF